MAAENDILSIGFDWKRTQTDADKVVAQLQRVVEAGNKITSAFMGLDVSGGFASSKKAAEELSGVLNEAKKSTEDFTKATAQSNTETAKSTPTTKQKTAATKELTLEEAKAKETTKQYNAEIRQQAKDAIAATSSLAKLKAQLTLAQISRDKLPVNSDEFKKAQDVVLALTTQIKGLESASGDFRRNVGNYRDALGNTIKTTENLTQSTNTFAKNASKAFSAVKTAANIIPGLGISGIFLLAFEAISQVIDGLDLFGTKAKEVNDDLKKISDESKEFNKSLNNTEASALATGVQLKNFVEIAKDGNRPLEERNYALKEANKIMGEHGEKLTLVNIQTKAVTEEVEKYTKALLQQALVSKYADRITELFIKQSDAQREITKAQEEYNKQFKITRADQSSGNFSFSETNKLVAANNALRQKQLIYNAYDAERVKNLKDLFKVQEETNVSLAELGTKEKESTKDVKTITDYIKELRKELDAIDKKQVTGLLGDTDADLERVKAYQKALEEIFKLGATEKTPIVRQLLFELSPVSLRILEDKISDYTKKNPIKYDLAPPDVKKAIQITKSYRAGEIAFTEEMLQRELVLQQTAALRELSILEAKYANGKVTREQYEKEQVAIQVKYSKKGLDEQIRAVGEEIKLMDFGTIARENAEKRLAELILAKNKIVSEDRKRKNDELIKQLQQIQDIFNQVSSLGASIVNANVIKQKNALQELEDGQQKSYENEVARINASSATEEQKNNLLNNLQKQREAQKEKFDRASREADQKKAAYDKQVAIMNIILNTAVAVAKAGFPLNILVAALGAAQLAVAIATPLPKYATGLKNSPTGHFGIYGEAGPEIYQEPGKDPVVVDTPTVGFIPKGTSITPIGKDEINGVMYRAMAKKTAETMSKTAGPERTEMLLGQLIAETKNAKDRIIVHNVFNKLPPGWGEYQRSYYSKK